MYLNKPNKMYKTKIHNRDMGSGGGGRIRSPGGEDARLNMSITNASTDHGSGFSVSGTGKHVPMQQPILHLNNTTATSKYSPRAISAMEYNGLLGPGGNGPLMTTGIHFGANKRTQGRFSERIHFVFVSDLKAKIGKHGQ